MPLLTGLPCQVPRRFSKIKEMLIRGKEEAVVASWGLLLEQLRSEIDLVSKNGPDVFPSIDFDNIDDKSSATEFASRLRKCGAGVIRGVIPTDVAWAWDRESKEYLSVDPAVGLRSTEDRQAYDVCWSPAQVKCRAHPDLLKAQRFLMTLWNCSDPSTLISVNHPISYADRIRHKRPADPGFRLEASMNGASVERWDPDKFGGASVYGKIWGGNWWNYDPWDSCSRVRMQSDSHKSANPHNIFRMFQGWLPLDSLPAGQGSLSLCPLLQLTTAYVLLRPFFSPVNASPTSADFLSARNWILESPSSATIPGAAPAHKQELTSLLHPHLDLSRSMIRIPSLDPGDYLVWHCDTVYAVDHTKGANVDATILYMPVCPLTEANALYLARQRRDFLLGLPGGDVTGSGSGEGTHMSRPGVYEVNEVGGEEGLQAMGLMPWDEGRAGSDQEATLLQIANDVLFPDRYSTC